MELLFKDIYPPADLRNNKLLAGDRAFHDWYRFVLSFPPHLVRDYLNRLSFSKKDLILDPFCGTGTTLVEAKKNDIASIGIEATAVAALATKAKTTWIKDFKRFESTGLDIAHRASDDYDGLTQDLLKLEPQSEKLLLKNSISPVPLHKCLLLLRHIEEVSDLDVRNALLVALAHTAVFCASNLKFGPEVGVRRKKKEDAAVFDHFARRVRLMADDLRSVANVSETPASVYNNDSTRINGELRHQSISGVITSPPYPNEKDYTRTTRLESVLLGLISSKQELRRLKHGLLRSNTRNVYVNDRDDELIPEGSSVDRIAREIERRRVDLNKTSGFERLYHRVTRLYFGGMKRHFLQLQQYLKPGARLAYVVGDQASYLQVMIRTGELLAEIAHEAGYEILDLELFRTRISTATGDQLREEVLLLQWNGGKGGVSVSKSRNRYDRLIENVFFKNYDQGASEVTFAREEFEPVAKELGVKLPKNLGDIIYSYRYRNKLPSSITKLLAEGEAWIIRSVGRGQYKFVKTTLNRVVPNPRLSYVKVPDATPEIISRYALNDEQALLAIIRYNRLIDTFLGITCYSLQSHLRTTVPEMGQVETDEMYVGVNKQGTHFIVPVQVKGANDELGIVQIEQDFAMCQTKFKNMVSRPVGSQFMDHDLIALFEFEMCDDEVRIKEEKHYRLVPNDDLSDAELAHYRKKQ